MHSFLVYWRKFQPLKRNLERSIFYLKPYFLQKKKNLSGSEKLWSHMTSTDGGEYHNSDCAEALPPPAINKYSSRISACGNIVALASDTRNVVLKFPSQLFLLRGSAGKWWSSEARVRFHFFQVERWCQQPACSPTREQRTRDLWAVLYSGAKHITVFLPKGCCSLSQGRNLA